MQDNLADAEEYIRFVLDAIGARDLFQYLQIAPKQYWEQLLWLGPDNWGGIRLVEEAAAAAPGDVMDLAGEGEEGGEEDDTAMATETAAAAEEEEAEWEDMGGTTALLPSRTPQKKGGKGRVTFASDVRSPGPRGGAKASATGGGSGKGGKGGKEVDEYAFLDNLLGGKGKGRKPRAQRGGDDDFDEDEEDDEEDDDEEEEDDGDAGGAAQGTAAEGEEGDPLLVAHWTLAEYLPPAAAEYFLFIVGEYLYCYRAQHQALKEAREALRQRAAAQGSGAEAEAAAAAVGDDEHVRTRFCVVIWKRLLSHLCPTPFFTYAPFRCTRRPRSTCASW